MDRDAVSAGVEKIGGLFSSAEIRILICYILDTVGEPIPANLLINQLHYEGIANIFELSDAIESLLNGGMISLIDTKDDLYEITPKGRETAQTLKTSLSFTVRDRACSAAIRMMARFKNMRNTNIEIISNDGRTYVSCSAIDNEHPFLTVNLMVADENQALCIKENFLNNTSEICTKIISLLTEIK